MIHSVHSRVFAWNTIVLCVEGFCTKYSYQLGLGLI